MKCIWLVVFLACTGVAQTAPAPTPLDIKYIKVEGAVWLDVSLLEVEAQKTGRFVGEVVIENEGWFTFYPGVIGAVNKVDPKHLRFTVSNPSRTDLLCKSRDEMLINFAEGSPSWPSEQGYGYHLRVGDHLKVSLEIENITDIAIQDGSVTIDLRFQPINAGPFRLDAYPMWFNARGCGPTDFDLEPGRNISSGTFEIPLDGLIVALQGSLRDHAEYLDVENRTREMTFLHQVAAPDKNGVPQPFPVVTPAPGTEFRVDRGDFVAIAAGYNNPAKTEAKAAGSGIALGLFIPIDESKMALLEKKSGATIPQAAQK